MMRSCFVAARATAPLRAVRPFAAASCSWQLQPQQARPYSRTTPCLGRRVVASGEPAPSAPTVQATEQSHQVQEAPRASEYDALTPVARNHLVRVYGNTAAGMASAVAGTSLMLFTPLGAAIPLWAPSLLSFVPLLGMMSQKGSPGARLGMFHSFATLLGMGAAHVAGSAAATGVLLPAVGLTGATFAGFTAAAMMAPAGSAVKMQGPLMAGLFGLIGVQLFSMFVAPTVLTHQLMMYAGLTVFSLFIASDTSRMIENANAGILDVVGDSTTMLLNIVNTFTFIVRILQGGGRDD